MFIYIYIYIYIQGRSDKLLTIKTEKSDEEVSTEIPIDMPNKQKIGTYRVLNSKTYYNYPRCPADSCIIHRE